ncbi:carboxymuconolactone decarboxylase family protein [Aestuariibius sp. 2305UL40-4]|uniref:carboxymuconolactone decarboxylase family protein n=1 Tax=Aestuariibius violaceus TaxID=3234132 RepID=UPI00345EF3A4
MTDEAQHVAAGRSLSDTVNPGLKDVLAERYDHLVPGFSDYVVGTAYGQIYNRPGLDLKTRQLATVAALAAIGGQTRPQLKVHVGASLKAGATRTEVTEVILQMSLYGGFPAMVNALNAAMEVFAEEDAV